MSMSMSTPMSMSLSMSASRDPSRDGSRGPVPGAALGAGLAVPPTVLPALPPAVLVELGLAQGHPAPPVNQTSLLRDSRHRGSATNVWRSTKSASCDECDDYFMLDVKGAVTTSHHTCRFADEQRLLRHLCRVNSVLTSYTCGRAGPYFEVLSFSLFAFKFCQKLEN